MMVATKFIPTVLYDYFKLFILSKYSLNIALTIVSGEFGSQKSTLFQLRYGQKCGDL